MEIWIWAVVAIVAIVGGLFIEYQKNKMKMMKLGHKNEQEVDELYKLVSGLKTRIENLEAIAAGEPEEFKTGAGSGMKEIEIDEPDAREENRENISQMARKQRG